MKRVLFIFCIIISTCNVKHAYGYGGHISGLETTNRPNDNIVLTNDSTFLTAIFDEALTRSFIGMGRNTITGFALERQRGGGIVTCAGRQIVLVPKTPFSTERIMKIFGSDSLASANTIDYYHITLSPTPEAYLSLVYETIGNANGEFTFLNVKDGTYYLIAEIIWFVNGVQGTAFMQRITVSGGETKRITLSSPNTVIAR